MKITGRKTGSIVILDLDGRLDIPGAALLKRTVNERMAEGTHSFGLNFAEVDYISKETVGTIVSIKKLITRAEGKLIIFSPHWDVRDYVEKFSFKADIPIVDDENAALTALGVEPPAETQGQDSGKAVYVALGSTSAFKEIFWSIKRLGGVDVERFEETAQALSGIGGKKVDVVLLDAMLPGDGPLQAVKELRMNPAYKNSIILAVGPDSTRSMYNAMREYGADDFVPVPFEREELVSSINKGQFFDLLRRKFDLWAEGYYDKGKKG